MSESDRRQDGGSGTQEPVPAVPGNGGAPTGPGPGAATDADELKRLRAEVARLRERLAAPPPRARGGGRPSLVAVRQVIAVVLVALAAFGAVASVVGVWGGRTTLNTDRWVATVGPLPEHPEINAAMATYLTGEVFEQLNVQQRLAQALPPKAAFLAGPTTSAVQDYVRDTIQKFMATEQFRKLWDDANRRAHAGIVAILEGRSQTVSVSGGTVTLNLLPIVNNVLVALESRLPTMFGKQLDLPALTSGQIPPGLEQRVETALGVSLPDDFAQIELYHRDGLGELQQAVLFFKRSVTLLVAGSLLLLALALLITPHRRRTLLQFGVGLALSVVVLTAVLRAVRDQLLGEVPDGLYRQGASVAMQEVFTTLRGRGDQLLWLGIALAVLAYLVGPGRLPAALRRSSVKYGRDALRTTRRVGTSGELRRWTARHLDPLRIGGAVLAALLALFFSSWTSLLVIALLLAAFELLVTLVARWGRGGDGPAGPAIAEPGTSGTGVTLAPS
ncbi:hypothetical protein [Actinomadura sp. 9N407]|uniref:hypothetical protein n=1 Tax=Actinomadura sp. 9N407 TaxID=3375154 RepID=UPI0037A84192